MEKKKILIVVGTRPNFIKVTRFREVVAQYPGLSVEILHTGQHFSEKMSDVFFRQLNMIPDHFLNVGEGTPVQQIARIIEGMENHMHQHRPDIVLVPGDVNSTFAAAFAANKMNIPVGHIESGLRSFDRSMPEEFNRILTDALADLLFVSEPSGLENLHRENIPSERVHFVGNTMIDTLVKFSSEINQSEILDTLKVAPDAFVLMTIHRPATVDTNEGLKQLLKLVDVVSENHSIVFPVHPRTRKNLSAFALDEAFASRKKLILTDALGYFEFQKLVRSCKFIITDSGGIQEESTFTGKPCLTLRKNTERPVTIVEGTNELLPFDLNLISAKIEEIRNHRFKKGGIPERWDGHATERIVKIVHQFLS